MNKHSRDNERYARQMVLPEIGAEGQQKLAGAKVLVVGAGGLGCPVLQYLAAAGIGQIGIVDGDIVAAANLNRQVLYGPEDVGTLKVKAAASAVHRINPDVAVKEYPFYLQNVLALKLVPKYDIVVDATDNFATRYMLNDCCALLRKPLVFAAISQWEGQVAVFHVPEKSAVRGLDYRDLFPDPPGEDEVPNCATAGVLGVLPGIIGAMQAAEVIKWITGAGQSLNQGILTFDLKTMQQQYIRVEPGVLVHGPADETAYLQTNYEWLCGERDVQEISSRDLAQIINRGAVFVDVREQDEQPELPVPHKRIPLSSLRQQSVQVSGAEVVVVCHHGIRSIEGVRLLSRSAPAGQKLYSLKGGIMALSAVVSNQTT